MESWCAIVYYLGGLISEFSYHGFVFYLCPGNPYGNIVRSAQMELSFFWT
jgi:hypothetical protein